MFGKFGRPRDLVPRDDIVDGPVGEPPGGERLAFEDGNQGSVGADQAGQPLGAATPWIDSQEHFGVADEELPSAMTQDRTPRPAPRPGRAPNR